MFFSSRKFYIPALIIVAVAVVVGYRQYNKSRQLPRYETVKVERGNLTQTVEATGRIESATALALRFEVGGTLDVVTVEEGDAVKAGELLVNLRLADLNAAVGQAQANLNQKLAGATGEERRYYKAAVDAAKAAWDQAKIDAQNNVTIKEAALDTAKNNLQLAEGGENSRIVTQEYENAVALLFTSLSVLDNGLAQADNILGIDNKFANDSFESLLSIADVSKLNAAEDYYQKVKTAKGASRAKILPLNLNSSHADIDAALAGAESATAEMNKLLTAVADVLGATLPGNNLTQSALETKKSTIETTRSAVTTHYTSLIKQKQDISDAKNSYSTYQIAHSKAQKDLDDAKAGAVSAVAAKEAAYHQAVANWQTKTVVPREVDVAYYRAALAQAVANRDKAILRAPINGIITKVNRKRGEFVAVSDVVIEMVSPNYEVKVDIPETDVAKVEANNAASITLDAYGEDAKFAGRIISIEPASTEIQDVVYYKVRIALDGPGEEYKPGMTANVAITTAGREKVLIIPLRAVRSGTDGRYARVLADGIEEERPVILGLKGDNGLVEIAEGLSEGEDVIINVKK